MTVRSLEMTNILTSALSSLIDGKSCSTREIHLFKLSCKIEYTCTFSNLIINIRGTF